MKRSFTARTVVVELDNPAAVSLDAPNRPAYHREDPVGGGRLRGGGEEAPAGLLHAGARVARRGGGGGPPPAGAPFNSQV